MASKPEQDGENCVHNLRMLNNSQLCLEQICLTERSNTDKIIGQCHNRAK